MTGRMPLAAAVLAVLAAFAAPAWAQSASLGKDGTPVTVDADDGIEWLRNEQMYVARGNARAQRGDMVVNADTLTALYRESGGSGTDVYRLEALGRVVITAPGRTARGDRGLYDIDQQVAVLLGKDLRMETGRETITASDTLEYWEQRRIAVARGDAVAVNGTRKISADVLTSYFAETRKGDLAVVRMEAVGNVVITTPQEVVRGAEGVYNVTRELATLRGNVRITRGVNQLNGEVAEVNLKTGVSRLLSGDKAKSRVRGLFVPDRKAVGK